MTCPNWRADQWGEAERAEWELDRHRCEARWVMRLRVTDRGTALGYLDSVQSKRGQGARLALEGDVKAQWALGNRGVHGDWRVKIMGDL